MESTLTHCQSPPPPLPIHSPKTSGRGIVFSWNRILVLGLAYVQHLVPAFFWGFVLLENERERPRIGVHGWSGERKSERERETDRGEAHTEQVQCMIMTRTHHKPQCIETCHMHIASRPQKNRNHTHTRPHTQNTHTTNALGRQQQHAKYVCTNPHRQAGWQTDRQTDGPPPHTKQDRQTDRHHTQSTQSTHTKTQRTWPPAAAGPTRQGRRRRRQRARCSLSPQPRARLFNFVFVVLGCCVCVCYCIYYYETHNLLYLLIDFGGGV